MLRKTLMAGALAALTFAAAGGAMAQQVREPRAMRADADGDNRISQAEFVGQRLQRLTAADANRDGTVTPEEMRATAETRMAQRADTRFQRLDANSDGSISRAEFDSQRAARAEARPERAGRPAGMHRGRAGMGHRGGRMEARGPVSIAEVQDKAEQAFTRLDTDRDGFLTGTELQAMREQRREGMAERRAAHHAHRQASPPAPASE